MALWIKVCGVRPVPVQQEELIAGDEFGDHQSLVLGSRPEVGHGRMCPADLASYHHLRYELKIPDEVVGQSTQVGVAVATPSNAGKGDGLLVRLFRWDIEHEWVTPRLYAHYT